MNALDLGFSLLGHLKDRLGGRGTVLLSVGLFLLSTLASLLLTPLALIGVSGCEWMVA
jgi:hypothetical protein